MRLNFFINAVSKKAVLILFNNDRQIISTKYIDIFWNESEKLTWIIDRFVLENKINYNDLQNLVVVNWPWSFTWVRTIVLIINTINFLIWKNITSINFFDLFDKYPIVKSSSKRDLFVKFDKKTKIEVIKNEDFIHIANENSIKEIFWDLNNKDIFDISLIDNINYDNIIRNLNFKKDKLISPLYIKKPNIS